MKRFLLVGLVFLAMTKAGFGADANFSQAISPDDFKAAGLDRLSPAERQHLDELIAAYKQGDVAAARRAADEAIKAKAEAEAATKAAEAATKAAEATMKAAQAETKAAKAEVTESKKSTMGFLAKAKVLLVPGTQIEYALIKTTITGKFEGWEGRTTFRLANGQRWQIANSDERYFTSPKENVEVEISPASLGGFWMNLPDYKVRVRVRLLSDN